MTELSAMAEAADPKPAGPPPQEPKGAMRRALDSDIWHSFKRSPVTIVAPRTVRANWAQFDRPMATMSTQTAALSCWLGGMMPRAMPKISNAIRIAGNDSWISAMRMITLS